MAKVEEVFRLSGVPTFTFVKPTRYAEILVSMRTPGRCLVIEGPSGIGKTSVVIRILQELGLEAQASFLSARRPNDVEYIESIPELASIGTVVVDDFHRLSDETKASLSDYMKVLADSEDANSKLVLIGINKIGQQLVKVAHDLGLRLDVYRLESNPDESIYDLIELGESALNVVINSKEDIIRRCQGSFQLAQLICHKVCVLGGISITSEQKIEITTSVNGVVEDILGDLSRVFKDVTVNFARGSKIRREGRAPYLHMLKWLSESDEWSVDLTDAVAVHPHMKGSIGQVLDKGHLATLLADKEKGLDSYFHYEISTSVLSVEDPRLVFYLKNLVWRVFTKQVGYKAEYFPNRYDFALSFAGADRDVALAIFEKLMEHELEVFYDENEQHRIIAQNVEDYLAPIYRSEAKYVIALMSPEYPTRIWTKFESDAFRERFGSNEVIPIRYRTVKSGFFTDDAKYGGLSFDPSAGTEEQVSEIVEQLCARLAEDRLAGAAALAAELKEDKESS
ncbi:TIR domain-containing protein [Amaricoccus sp.]|uniref:TIR domain-containing protein n=1 Tax=Amaricoccus sp. TaxID=1872485 RepID=UPI001B6CA637|nr:TIR domain-containing protein [Amaricoccus sp.]MBP7000335.1 TIR domain-containing protein [Amaricoccus sp.]